MLILTPTSRYFLLKFFTDSGFASKILTLGSFSFMPFNFRAIGNKLDK
jgi:hypothetical protein